MPTNISLEIILLENLIMKIFRKKNIILVQNSISSNLTNILNYSTTIQQAPTFS